MRGLICWNYDQYTLLAEDVMYPKSPQHVRLYGFCITNALGSYINIDAAIQSLGNDDSTAIAKQGCGKDP